ncbi:LPXTG cell wall anchor domain-containing protein [Enterococcus sp. DIV0849a]
MSKFVSDKVGFQYRYIKMTDKNNTAISRVLEIPMNIFANNRTVDLGCMTGLNYQSFIPNYDCSCFLCKCEIGEWRKMMKKRVSLIKIALSSILALAFLGLYAGNVIAEENPEVSVKGEITLFEEAPIDSSEPPITKPSDTTPDETVKPKGKLPSTGELVKYGSMISGGLLLIVVTLFYFIKRSKERTEAKEGSDE